MKKGKMTSLLLILVIIFIWFKSPSQTFCDTLFTRQGDTIPCMITYINGQNIFYHQKIKKRIIEHEYLLANQIQYRQKHNCDLSFKIHVPFQTHKEMTRLLSNPSFTK